MKVITIISCYLLILTLHSTTIREIENNKEYLCGKGIALTEKEADDLALQDLLSQISVDVKQSVENIETEQDGVFKEQYKSVVETYSSAKLYDAKRIVDLDSFKPKFQVIRYIPKQRIDDVFKERKSRVMTLLNEGELAEEKGKVADAIRNYYWAFALLPTIPDYKTMNYYFEGKGECEVYTGLHNKLGSIIGAVKFKKISTRKGSNYTEYLLDANYEGVPVEGILLHYSDGNTETPTVKWSNGQGVVRLPNKVAETSSKLTLFVDYEYRMHAFDQDVRCALDEMSYKKLPESIKEIPLGSNIKALPAKDKLTLKSDPDCPEKLKTTIQTTLDELLDIIKDSDYGKARKYFTAGGYRDFNRLIDYGKAKLMNHDLIMGVFKIQNNFVVRSVPMAFDFANSGEKFTENVNFVFNQDGKIEKITFALSDNTLKSIREQKGFNEAEKKEITHFMELYKTSYCLKDSSFVKDVFADDALIIIGNMVQKDPSYDVEGIIGQLGNEKVKYVKMSKEEYLGRLTKQFEQKEFINIHFADCDLKKFSNLDEKVFGIQISQYYYSSNYADKGYLFLMFNLEDPEKPRITVRSWQPEKFADGSIVGLQDFKF